MKVTKYVHSCLLAEEAGQTVLIDPGNFSFDSGLVDFDKLPQLDYLLITHTHGDHYHLPFIKQALAASPEVTVVTNKSVQEALAAEDITATTNLPEFATVHQWSHEPLPWALEAPENVGFTLWNKLTHPGDSFQVDHSAEVLALPMQAPWGHTKQAVDLALTLKPKVIIPTHDYHWRDELRQGFYARSVDFFDAHGIRFVAAENGVAFEL